MHDDHYMNNFNNDVPPGDSITTLLLHERDPRWHALHVRFVLEAKEVEKVVLLVPTQRQTADTHRF